MQKNVHNIPQPLHFDAEVAVELGLEEAILLAYFQAAWLFKTHVSMTLTYTQLSQRFPFWQLEDIERITRSLSLKKAIQLISAPLTESNLIEFSFHDTAIQQEPISTKKKRQLQLGQNRISPHWQPDKDIIEKLTLDHGIPPQFSRRLVTGFVRYWLDSGETSHSWASKFYQWVVRQYHQQKSEVNFITSAEQPFAIKNQWQPHEDAVEILTRQGINHHFIEDAIAEFVLYWREKGTVTQTWNSKFIQHVKRQWAIYTQTLKSEHEPTAMTINWQPKKEVFDILLLANITPKFAEECIQEFVLYWQETGRIQSAWNTKFLQHVKYRWAQQAQIAGGLNEGQSLHSEQGQSEFIQKHSDRSWAEGL